MPITLPANAEIAKTLARGFYLACNEKRLAGFRLDALNETSVLRALNDGGAVDRFKFARRMRFDLPKTPGRGHSVCVNVGKTAVYAKILGVEIAKNAFLNALELVSGIRQSKNTIGKTGQRFFPRRPIVV